MTRTMVGRIGSYAEFVDAIDDENLILVEHGDHQMATVSLNGRHVLTGNTWDFYPGCHGGWFYELDRRWGCFNSPSELVLVLYRAVEGEARRVGREAATRIEAVVPSRDSAASVR